MTQPRDNSAEKRGVLAIDVGNSRIKLGWFPAAAACTSEKPPGVPGLDIAAPTLPMPAETIGVRHRDRETSEWLSEIHRWCADTIDVPVWRGLVASVNPAAADALVSALSRAGNIVKRITGTELPLAINVERPERAGIDRLLNAVAARKLVPSGAVIVVDMGTATTVDLVDAEGAFAGGAILPGPAVSAAALHAGTAALPDLSSEVWTAPPPPVGTSTESAIAAGVFWGSVGSAVELVRRIAANEGNVAQVLLTGGAASAFADVMDCSPLPLRHVPHLTLAGLAAAAAQIEL